MEDECIIHCTISLQTLLAFCLLHELGISHSAPSALVKPSPESSPQGPHISQGAGSTKLMPLPVSHMAKNLSQSFARSEGQLSLLPAA